MDVDALVIGAGFGGLGAALTLAEAGQRVLLVEALAYPGGCACTFEKHGARFDAGATLLTGMRPGMWIPRTLAAAGVEVMPTLLDPVIGLRTPGLSLTAGADRSTLEAALLAHPGAPHGLRGFLDFQRRVADALWDVLDHPEALPPLTGASVSHHLRHLPVWIELARFAGQPLEAVLLHFGIAGFTPLRTWLDAMCQITVQAGVSEAEAPVALGAVDFFFRGCAVLPGGMGELADAFVTAIRKRGGEVRLANRVKRLERKAGGWCAHTRHGSVTAPTVIANLLPDDLALLAGLAEPRLARRSRDGWGAATLYLRTRAPELGPLTHLELVADPGAPLPGGNHVLVSASPPGPPRAPDGERVVTCSTHVALPAGRSEVEAAQARMADTIARLAPEILEGESVRFTGSPRTFARFTRRSGGRVGGVPRRAGLLPYLELLPTPLEQGLWVVGDATGLGQSTLATALSGERTARATLVG